MKWNTFYHSSQPPLYCIWKLVNKHSPKRGEEIPFQTFKPWGCLNYLHGVKEWILGVFSAGIYWVGGASIHDVFGQL